MRKFPISINVNNKERFEDMYLNRVKCYLRKEIYEFLISRRSESEFFSIIDIQRQYSRNNSEEFESILMDVLSELREHGWKSEFSFSGKDLYIFSGDLPDNCYTDKDVLT